MTQSDARARVLIGAQELAGLIGERSELVILAVRNPVPGTAVSHAQDPRIPGAVDIDLPSELAGPQSGHSGARPLPAIAALQDNARRWGLRRSSSVVVYDHDRCLQAGRAWWVLKWAGITDVRMLDGGFAQWLAAGLPISHHVEKRPPGDVVLSAGHLPVLDADQAARLARAMRSCSTRASAQTTSAAASRRGNRRAAIFPARSARRPRII